MYKIASERSVHPVFMELLPIYYHIEDN